MISSAAKIFIPAVIAFIAGILMTPLVSHYLYKYKLWKKTSVKNALGGGEATITQQLHGDDIKKTPRMGGIIVWGGAIATALIVWIISKLLPTDATVKLDFLSRNQTWLPFFTLIVTAAVGLVDDWMVVRDNGSYVGGGLSLGKRLVAVLAVAIVGAWWFYAKLGVSSIDVPFLGEMMLGIWFIPLFIAFMIGIYSGGIIDGIDGLSGGIFSVLFSSYALLAYHNNQIDLAAFCMVIVGALIAFLWFNIPPARFYLSETGTMALTTTLVVVAFLTKSVVVLPIIAFPLIATSASSLIQILSRKFRNGKKVFLVAPLHNHFQAKGWPPYKVTMRYWIISVMFASLGLIIAFIG
jgi:phospho-N-acetylmuramoyl-pentapeptide-transferase